MEDVRYLSHIVDCSNACSKKLDRDELRAFLDTFSQGLHRRMRKLIIALRDVAGEFNEDDTKYGLFLGQDWDLYFLRESMKKHSKGRPGYTYGARKG